MASSPTGMSTIRNTNNEGIRNLTTSWQRSALPQSSVLPSGFISRPVCVAAGARRGADYRLAKLIGEQDLTIEPADGADRADQQSALALALAAIVLPRDHAKWRAEFRGDWAVVLVAVVLSWLTFRFVEIPLRRRQNVVPKLSFGLIAVGMAEIVTAVASGFGFRFSPEIRDIAQLSPQNNVGFRDKCFLEVPGSEFNSSCIEQGEKPLLLLWGDSTAAALYPGLKKAQETVPFRLARFAAPACAPILSTGSNARCDQANDLVFGFIKSSHPEIVLLHAMWDKNNDLDQLRETIRRLKALDIPRIVILGPVPVWKRTLPHALVNSYRFRHAIADRIATGMSGPQGDAQMEAFSKAAGVEYISA